MRPEFLEERKSKKEIGQSRNKVEEINQIVGQMVYCKIQLFSEKYFTGQCQGFVENFASLGYRRCTPKSAIVEDGSWTLYSNLGFQGRYLILPPGRYENLQPVLQKLGFYEAQSIKCQPTLRDDPSDMFRKMNLNEMEMINGNDSLDSFGNQIMSDESME